jgi:hypothetical protein
VHVEINGTINLLMTGQKSALNAKVIAVLARAPKAAVLETRNYYKLTNLEEQFFFLPTKFSRILSRN